ncbi:MAG: MFS transporter [Actinomycetota bacterium]|nr:MFS transporter [Actinomycetota bacterium]
MRTAGGSATRLGKQLGRREFTALLALSMALSALGIDLMLPAFPAMRRDLGLAADSTAVAGLVTAYFLGLALGQLGYGPLADRYGRRATLYLGYGVYAVGALAATLSPTLPLLLASRFVWGLGAAGPRVVTLAVIRDTFEGEQMSRAMSFIMAVFIVVPVFAPTLGAAVATAVSWRWLFAGCAFAAVVMGVWAVRLPETLRPEHRRPLRFGSVLRGARVVVSDRRTVGYTLAMASLYGVFASYLGGAEIIFGDTFGQAANFPLLFGGLAAVMGAAMLANARMVVRVGTRQLTHGVLIGHRRRAAVRRSGTRRRARPGLRWDRAAAVVRRNDLRRRCPWIGPLGRRRPALPSAADRPRSQRGGGGRRRRPGLTQAAAPRRRAAVTASRPRRSMALTWCATASLLER